MTRLELWIKRVFIVSGKVYTGRSLDFEVFVFEQMFFVNELL